MNCCEVLYELMHAYDQLPFFHADNIKDLYVRYEFRGQLKDIGWGLSHLNKVTTRHFGFVVTL